MPFCIDECAVPLLCGANSVAGGSRHTMRLPQGQPPPSRDGNIHSTMGVRGRVTQAATAVPYKAGNGNDLFLTKGHASSRK
jgi:hypothetical protein